MKRFKPYFLLLNFSFFIFLTGCRKDLCYNHDEHSFSVKVDIVADWACEIPCYQRTDATIFSTERVNTRLQNAISDEPADLSEGSSDGVETTDDELAGLRIVQAIAAELVDPTRIVPRDNKSYYNILLDDTIRQQVCRLYLNTSNWYIGTYETKEEVKEPIEKLADIYRHREQILAAIRRYEGGKE